MKKILITIASVLLVTAVVGVAYAQEADDGPIVTAPPESSGAVPVVPESTPSTSAPEVAGAPPQPVIRFEFSGDIPANFDISKFQGKDFHFNELPESAQRLFIQGLPSADRPLFENLRASDGNSEQFRVLAPNGDKFKGSYPWDGLVQNWKNRPDSWSISHSRHGTGHELRGTEVPKAYWITWKRKF